MTSRKIEVEHKLLLDKLLSNTGVECQRSKTASSELSTVSDGNEEEDHLEAHDEEVQEKAKEETEKESEEETHEEPPIVFPSPSLRKILPESVRAIEDFNKIHVLPQEFRTDLDPALIPKINSTPQQKYIEILAQLTGSVNFKSSLAEFWFLDTLANLLRRAQNDGMKQSSQAILILWFCEWMKEIQNFDAADRKRMLKRFEENMLSAAKFISDTDRLPTPQEVGVFYRAEEVTNPDLTAPESKHLVTFEGATYECSLLDLTNIIHYIYDLFSTDYQYDLLRSVFTFTPMYKLTDAPNQMRNPKPLFSPLKPLLKEKSPKKEKVVGKGKKDFETEEYLTLLELREKVEREQNEQEEKDREDWNRRTHILPLAFAVDDQFFNQYWPPPSETEPELDNKGKGKGKKK